MNPNIFAYEKDVYIQTQARNYDTLGNNMLIKVLLPYILMVLYK